MNKNQFGRRDKLIQEKRIDTYQQTAKLPEPTLCPRCGCIFSNGRWSWMELPETTMRNINKTLCSACKRIEDNVPAGYIDLTGEFFVSHKNEILNLIKNEADAENKEHPMERIMEILEKPDGVSVSITTTGIHVARRLSEAIEKSYKGQLDYIYGDDEKTIRVRWCR